MVYTEIIPALNANLKYHKQLRIIRMQMRQTTFAFDKCVKYALYRTSELVVGLTESLLGKLEYALIIPPTKLGNLRRQSTNAI